MYRYGKVTEIDRETDIIKIEFIRQDRAVKNKRKDWFVMKRLVEDITWMKRFSVTDLMIFELFAESMDRDNMLVVSVLFKQSVMAKLGIFPNVYYNSVRKLVEKDLLVKLTSTDFMVNPKYYFKCDARSVKGLLEQYILHKQSIGDGKKED